MDTLTYWDGKWHEGNPQVIGIKDHAMWLASTIFDGARAFNRLVPDLDRHCERAIRSAIAMGLKPTVDAKTIEKLAREAVKRFPPDAELYIRPTFWGKDGFIYPDPDSTQFALIVYISPFPAKLAETCHGELDISGVYHDDVIDTETMHWCCHARFILSASMSDGTVSFETGKEVEKRAEEITRKQGIKVVTTINTTNAFADLAKDFTYRKLPLNNPQPKELEMSHAAACLLCNPDFAKQCEVQVIKEFALADTVKKHLKGRVLWCAHTIQALADVLIDRENGEELIDKIIPFAEQVAKEKGHPGVITRDLFIALG